MRRYVAGIYWTGIVLISIVGTQITDNLSDNYGMGVAGRDACASVRILDNVTLLTAQQQ